MFRSNITIYITAATQRARSVRFTMDTLHDSLIYTAAATHSMKQERCCNLLWKADGVVLYTQRQQQTK